MASDTRETHHWCQTLTLASVYRLRASRFNPRSRLCVSQRVLLHYNDMMNYIYWHWIKMQHWQQRCEKWSIFIMNGLEVSGVTLLYFSRLQMYILRTGCGSCCVLYLPIHSAYLFSFFMYASGIIGMFSIIVDIRLDLSQFFVQSCTVLLYKAI